MLNAYTSAVTPNYAFFEVNAFLKGPGESLSSTYNVLTNALNSCPPDFSMFNATFGEDQQRSIGDYLELAMQFQYNKRTV